MGSYYTGGAEGFIFPTGRYHAPPSATVTTTIYASNGFSRALPVWFPRATAIDRIGIEVTLAGEAGSVIRLGAWASDTTTGLPNALLYDFGTVPGDTTTWTPITVAVTLGPGVVWLSDSAQAAVTTRPTVRTISTYAFPHLAGGATHQTTAQNFALPFASTTGALPPTIPTLASPTNIAGRIQWRTV
jgi:hypothetical protein